MGRVGGGEKPIGLLESAEGCGQHPEVMAGRSGPGDERSGDEVSAGKEELEDRVGEAGVAHPPARERGRNDRAGPGASGAGQSGQFGDEGFE